MKPYRRQEICLALAYWQPYNNFSLSKETRFQRAATYNSAGWSSLVARRAHNPEVVGSNPAPATKHEAPDQQKWSGVFLMDESQDPVLWANGRILDEWTTPIKPTTANICARRPMGKRFLRAVHKPSPLLPVSRASGMNLCLTQGLPSCLAQ